MECLLHISGAEPGSGSQGKTAFATASYEVCPYVKMSLSSNVAQGMDTEAWACSGMSTYGLDSAFKWTGQERQETSKNHCYEPTSMDQWQGYFGSPCLNYFDQQSMSRDHDCVSASQAGFNYC